MVSPASPHPASPRYFLGGDKAQDVVFTLISEYACLLPLPPNREKEVSVCGGGAFMLIHFMAGNHPYSISFLPGVEKPPQRLAKEE